MNTIDIYFYIYIYIFIYLHPLISTIFPTMSGDPGTKSRPDGEGRFLQADGDLTIMGLSDGWRSRLYI